MPSKKAPMFTLILVLHALFCLFLIVVILLQSGKGAGIGAAFGGASQTVFGPRGAASLLSRITAIVAAAFMITSITLAWLSSSSSSQMEKKVAALQDVKAKSATVDLSEKPTEALPSAPASPEPIATENETDLHEDVVKAEEAAAEPPAPKAPDAKPVEPAASPAEPAAPAE
jgi:preprotein translocase subunit SecG